jgi:hypothetical protein
VLVWLRILALFAAVFAIFGFAIVALVAAISYSASGVKFDKTRFSSNLSIHYGLAGGNGQVELRWAERIPQPPAPGGLGRAVFVYTIVTRSPRAPISKPPSLPARLGFHWWTTQPDEASSPSFWRIPYKVGAPAWFVLPVSVLGCIWAAIQVARRWERLVATRHAAQGHCQGCGYDLRATPDRCPECGRTTRKSNVAQVQIRG